MILLRYKLPFFPFLLGLCLLAGSCRRDKPLNSAGGSTLFQEILSHKTHIDFTNQVKEDQRFNGLIFSYAYNGAGVAAVDLDNDGLTDLVFLGNQSGPSLYKNKGAFQFEPVAFHDSIAANRKGWFTGISYADVNRDDLQDLYIARSGTDALHRSNLLYLNQGGFRFKEAGALWGLNDSSPSTQGVFMDYDRDGDPDCLVINHPSDFSQILNPFAFEDSSLMTNGTDKLFRNDGTHFTDVTREAGLSNTRGFTLSAAILDVNQDGYPDIFLANDFISNDQLLINQAGKGFKDETTRYLSNTSLFSMGSDFADLNRDGILDLGVVDMKPDNHFRVKNNLVAFPIGYYQNLAEHFKPTQRIKNSFYLGTPNGTFQECAQLLGMDQTDWSWSLLMEDFNMDGNTDVYITNGTVRDLHDLDFILLQESAEKDAAYFHQVKTLYQKMPVTLLPNVAFCNDGQLNFKPVSREWGLQLKGISSGAVVADFDNDGDPDLAVSNTHQPASIYRNNSKSKGCKVMLNDPANQNLFGAEILLHTKTKTYRYPIKSVRGYASQSEAAVYLPQSVLRQAKDLQILWPDGKQQQHPLPDPSQTRLSINKSAPSDPSNVQVLTKPGFTLKAETIYQHPDSAESNQLFAAFKRERLLPFDPYQVIPKCSNFPLDSTRTLCISGGTLVITENGTSSEPHTTILWESKIKHLLPSDFLLEDFNQDGKTDILLALISTAAQHEENTLRLLIQKDQGWEEEKRFPSTHTPWKCLSACDLNGDQVPDVFCGADAKPYQFPDADHSMLFLSVASGWKPHVLKGLPRGFCSIAKAIPPDQSNHNQFYCAIGYQGIWSISLNREKNQIITQSVYPWNRVIFDLECYDFNRDGKNDLLIAGEGLNIYPKYTEQQPMEIYLGDFDHNGSIEPLVTHYLNGQKGLFPDRNTLCEQMPSYRNIFLTYRDYATKNVFQYIDTHSAQLKGKWIARESRHGILYQTETAAYHWKPFPNALQIHPVRDFQVVPMGKSGIGIFYSAGTKNNLPSNPDASENGFGVLLNRGDYSSWEEIFPVGAPMKIPPSGKMQCVFHQQQAEVILPAQNGRIQKLIIRLPEAVSP